MQLSSPHFAVNVSWYAVSRGHRLIWNGGVASDTGHQYTDTLSIADNSSNEEFLYGRSTSALTGRIDRAHPILGADSSRLHGHHIDVADQMPSPAGRLPEIRH